MSLNKENHREVLRWGGYVFDKIPSRAYGVYAFWRRDNGKCIYVGQAAAQPIKERLRNYWKGDSHNETLKLWIRAFGDYLDVCYTEVQPSKINGFERRLIRLWRPEANKQHNR